MPRRVASFVCSAALAAAGTFAPAAARAEPSVPEVSADDLSVRAIEAFSAKQYDLAIELFGEAYDIDPNPNYLFNIGRVYEEKGDLNSAIELYQRFVAQPGVELTAREAATGRLKVLRAAVAQLEDPEDETEAAATTKRAESPAPVGSGDKGRAPDGQDADSAAPQGRSDRRSQRIAGYTLVGVGGAALVTGGVLGGLALRNAGDADSAEFVDESEELRDDARGFARGADALFISGGILAAAGLALVLTTWLPRKKTRRSAGTAQPGPRVSFRPAAGPSLTGATVGGRF